MPRLPNWNVVFDNWFAIAEHVGHAMPFKVLTDDTRKVIYRSEVRSATDERNLNLRLNPIKHEHDDDNEKGSQIFVKARKD
jgi:hypothetical protein